MSDLRYEPIVKAEHQIRLLQVKHETDDDHIHLQLRTISITKDTPKFQALSYTWGEAGNQTLRVNGCAFPVSDNLLGFLETWGQQLAKDGTWLWIDQICIDQDNNVEKSWQVPLMAEIYSKAARTIIWLGPASSSVSAFAHHLRHVKGVTEIDLGPTSVDYRWWPQDCSQGIADIYNAPYWTRVWIVQEVIVSKEVVVFCGPHELPWNLFSVLTAMSSPIMPDTVHFLQFHRGRAEHGKRVMALGDALRNFDTSQCKTPKDNFYGLLALLPSIERRMIAVDYSQRTDQVYLDALQVAWGRWGVFKVQQKASRIENRNGTMETLNLGRRMGVLKLDGGNGPWRNAGEIEDAWARELYDAAMYELSLRGTRAEFFDWLRGRLEEKMSEI